MADKSKQDLANMLSGGEPKKPEIRRGQGMRLSTEAAPANAETQERTIASTQQSEIAQTQERTNAEMRNRINAEAQQSETAETQERISAKTQQRENAETQKKPKRVNRGYMLREDLVKKLRLLAVQEDRNLYEVMEEALEQYLERRKGG